MTEALLAGLARHLPVLPILVPLLAGAAMMLLGEARRDTQAALGLGATALQILIAAALLVRADAAVGAAPVMIYRLGDWPAQFGIVLVADRWAAAMLVLSNLLGFACLLFALARWHRAGSHFHPLVQFQLMGLAGAFLTGDLFNLFVFFEIMLAASYGLALHGSGPMRVRAGLHYITINLVASLLFLIGASLIYGATGTLNMADLALRVAGLGRDSRTLLEAGAALLGAAFLIKAAMWPLGFWLPTTYAAACAPAAALLSILSKVGLTAILRLWFLLFGAGSGPSAWFGQPVLLAGGLLTVLFGTVSVLATQDRGRLGGACVLVSSGTVLTALGVLGAQGGGRAAGGVLFYIISAVPAIAAFFLLVELIERGRDLGTDVLAVSLEAFGEPDEDEFSEGEEYGLALPAALATLGSAFLVCALLLAGLPPLSGFVAKLAILMPVLGAGAPPITPRGWVLLAALLLPGLATMVAMLRTGIDLFWSEFRDGAVRVRLVEAMPIALLLAVSMALTVLSGPALRFTGDAAHALQSPRAYGTRVLEGGT